MPKSKKNAPPAPPQNGIRELVWVDPQSLDENPLNWRKHPKRQTDAIGASIQANGWADTLLFNENTGRLIDGHARREVAINEGLESVPVLMGWWTPEQEVHLLATLDPLGAMAETDAGALSNLTDMLKEDQESLSQLEEKDREILDNVTDDLDAYAFNVSVGDDRSTFLPRQRARSEEDRILEETEVTATPMAELVIHEDIVFESSNDWGIPDLDEEMLADVHPDTTWDRSEETVTETSIYCHSARPFPEKEGGVLAYFTEDKRFESLWNSKAKQADKLIGEAWDGVCLPDYSIYSDHPLAERIWNTYRQRWLGRFWQLHGIPVIPIISGMVGDYHDSYFLETLPKFPPVVAMQVRTINKGGKQYWQGVQELISRSVSIVEPEKFIIYGGIENRKRLGTLPKNVEFIMLDAYMTKRRHKLKEKN